MALLLALSQSVAGSVSVLRHVGSRPIPRYSPGLHDVAYDNVASKSAIRHRFVEKKFATMNNMGR